MCLRRLRHPQRRVRLLRLGLRKRRLRRNHHLLSHHYRALPPPPSCPAPGTVNPMDIMPASTEPEVWHRTDYELLVSSHSRLAAASLPPDHQNSNDNTDSDLSTMLDTPLTVVAPRLATATEPPTPAQATERLVQDPPRLDAAYAADKHSPHHLSPLPTPEPGAHRRHLSDESTDPSSHNTPFTHLDGHTPESSINSDLRHSSSPQPVASSAKPDVFRCNIFGCHQTFDQQHKLK